MPSESFQTCMGNVPGKPQWATSAYFEMVFELVNWPPDCHCNLGGSAPILRNLKCPFRNAVEAAFWVCIAFSLGTDARFLLFVSPNIYIASFKSCSWSMSCFFILHWHFKTLAEKIKKFILRWWHHSLHGWNGSWVFSCVLDWGKMTSFVCVLSNNNAFVCLKCAVFFLPGAQVLYICSKQILTTGSRKNPPTSHRTIILR